MEVHWERSNLCNLLSAQEVEQGVWIQPVLLCRSIPAQYSKALSCWRQVETIRRDWKKEKAVRT